MRERLADLPLRDGRPHSCLICQGRAPETAFRKCPALDKERAALREAEKKLRRRGLWKGGAWFRALRLRHSRVAAALDLAGGEADPNWPVALAELAATVRSARRIERFAAAERRREEEMRKIEAERRRRA
jgi:hypothetical protein